MLCCAEMSVLCCADTMCCADTCVLCRHMCAVLYGCIYAAQTYCEHVVLCTRVQVICSPLRLVVAVQGSVHDQGILRNLQIMYQQGLSLHLVCLLLIYLQHYYTTLSVYFIACSEQT